LRDNLNKLVAYQASHKPTAFGSPKVIVIGKEIEQFGQDHFGGCDRRIADCALNLYRPSVVIVSFAKKGDPKPRVRKIPHFHHRR
jgi:hypothetical protein